MQINEQDAQMWRENSRGAARFFGETVIHVEPAASDTYPKWVTRLVHPELESIGPSEYDFVEDVEFLSHATFGDGMYLNGNVMHDHISSAGLIPKSFGLADAQALVQKGPDFFRKFVGEDIFLYCWRALVCGRGNYRAVLRLCLGRNQIHMDWNGVIEDCGKDGITPYFK